MNNKPKVGEGQHRPHFPELLSLLRNEPRQSQQQEAALLEEVAVQFSGVYEFVGHNNPSAKHFGELFDALVAYRLKHAQWRAAMRPEHLMQVLQCVRLMSRDETLRRKLDADALKGIFEVFDREASAHFSGSITPFQVEILTEIASILKRLAGEEWGLDELVRCQVHPVLLRLLHSNDPTVLPLVLVALIGFAAHKDHYALVANTEGLDVVLHILQHYDLPFKRLAADLLALLARREAVVSELLAMNGLGRLVGQLQSGDAALTQSLLRVVCYMANGGAALQEMYQTGTIPILLSLVAAVVRDLAASPAASALPSSRITDMQLVCTALTRIAEDDELAYSIRQCNGVTLLGKLLLVQPAPTQDAKSAERAAREVDSLRAYAFRALRFLFSMERNRKVFKRLFPPDLFAAFIDVGHYTANLNAYAQLVSIFDDLSEKQRAGVAAALDDISSDREADALRTVKGGQYVVLEMLGKGAYGAVYRARRARGEALVALKEIPLSDMSIFGATDAERSAGLGRMCKEVEILSSLDHPNIVQYYESFADGPYLYIVMELVEGSSLLDHITSLAEKGRRMPESDIWQEHYTEEHLVYHTTMTDPIGRAPGVPQELKSADIFWLPNE
ncbi:hypothetical protein DUNSADRAFT_15906 [Dunaliella salina]|uniref:non-specific serine/threonine protein kinase n=1 Tax=Dunaliella salina TaxID=3046 RepID=A0ABQ7H1C4_DUNSA|nr:hypothetical protein DUNSADRAFT_15906 [Dunaliella salina]|eukprot:KAF5840663.1 hypothetical protein DUNSADRAFT_15906 [Dunaliella salina]